MLAPRRSMGFSSSMSESFRRLGHARERVGDGSAMIRTVADPCYSALLR